MNAELRNLVTIVIPTLNEEKAIGLVIDQLHECGYVDILVVDGFSNDQTVQISKEKSVKVILQKGKGKAGAIITASEIVSTPYMLVMDGDCSYDPKDIDRFLLLEVSDYDEIVGFRPSNSPFISTLHKWGNFILTNCFNILMGSHIPDVACGLYLLKVSSLKKMDFSSHGLTIDQQILAQMVIMGRVQYLGINYRQRLGESKSTTWRQGFRALWEIINLARRFNPALLFSFVAMLAIFPAFVFFLEGMIEYLFLGAFRSGLFIASTLFLILGGLGLTVSTLSVALARIERKLEKE